MQRQVVFEVGEVYSNRNGRYRVAEIHRGGYVMSIVYLHSGLEQTTPVALQQRISRNLRWERRDARFRAKQDERKYLVDHGKSFSGLVPDDFGRTVKGTQWRERDELAGVVAKKLSASQRELTFTSWAVARRPITCLIHREEIVVDDSKAPETNARFTIEVDGYNLYYGLIVESGAGFLGEVWDWSRFIEALRKDKSMREAVRVAEETHNAKIIGRVLEDDEKYYYADAKSAVKKLWANNDDAGTTIDEQLKQIAGAPENARAEIYILANQSKADAVGAKTKIADKIVELMKTLLPIYAAAAT